jgi:hypothetical protein
MGKIMNIKTELPMDHPIITPENHAHLTRASETYEYAWKECMEANNSINSYLEEKLGKRFDYGGRYATRLNNFGISHQTDNGWWSLAAVDPDNLEAFIKDYTDETGEFNDKVSDIQLSVMKLKKIGRFEARYNKVYKIIQEFNSK